MQKIKYLFIGFGVFLPSLVFGATYSSNVMTGGTASQNACLSSYCADKAFDANSSTKFVGQLANSTSLGWVKYDLGSGTTKNIKKMSFWPYADGGGAMIKNLSVYASADDATYTEILATTTLSDTTSDNIEQAVYFSTTTEGSAYRYWKIFFNDSYNNGFPNAPQIYTIEGYECTDCTYGGTQATSSIWSVNMFVRTCETVDGVEQCYDSFRSFLALVIIFGIIGGVIYGSIKLWNRHKILTYD